jgi:hypothetical protein
MDVSLNEWTYNITFAMSRQCKTKSGVARILLAKLLANPVYYYENPVAIRYNSFKSKPDPFPIITRAKSMSLFKPFLERIGFDLGILIFDIVLRLDITT